MELYALSFFSLPLDCSNLKCIYWELLSNYVPSVVFSNALPLQLVETRPYSNTESERLFYPVY